MQSGLLLLGIAVDPIHAGAGRAPGVVDLPVQRDALGYPIVYASSVKGALKTLCAKELNCSIESDDRGRILCSNNCSLCCCLFGPEPGEGDKGAGRLAILDLVPLALPAPSAEYGFVYITSPVLISRALLVLEAVAVRLQDGDQNAENVAKALRGLLEKLQEKARNLPSGEVAVVDGGIFKGGAVTVGATPLTVREKVSVEKRDELEKALSRLGGLAGELLRRLVVSSSQDGPVLVERALLRVTRVALRRDRKTVMTGALWTEEYLPYGTVFLTAVIDTGFKNEYCDKANVDDPLGELRKKVLKEKDKDGRFYVIVGGKETVGKGLIKFVTFQVR